MFAIPGILALIFFIYVRPQEIVTSLQALPLLYLFFGLAIFGLAVDVRRRINRAAPAPQTVWVIGYWLWSLLTVAIYNPADLMRGGLVLTISLLLYALVAQSIHNFRAFQLVATLLFVLSIFLGVITAHQAKADFGCIVLDPTTTAAMASGEPDGRPCETEFNCYQGDPEPGADYLCERIGLLGTTSIAGGRVRYRGVLQDPNELGLAITMGLMLGFAVFLVKPGLRRGVLLAISLVVVAAAVNFTRSRSGQLALVAALGSWAVYRWRWKAVIVGLVVAGPLFAVISAGSHRHDADASTEERMEAWSVAIELFRSSPVFGVGSGQFTQHHFLTAHNSFLLAAAETGYVGFLLWATTLYTSFKIPVVALRRYLSVPEARVAVLWSMATLASLVALVIGGSFISWTNHEVTWIYLGLSGGLYGAIRSHDPDFRIQVGLPEIAAVGVGCGVLLVVLQFYLRLKGAG